MTETVTVPKETLVKLLECMEEAIQRMEAEFPWDYEEEREVANELRPYVGLPPMDAKA